MNKCILVGNSSSALNKELGFYIDSFENVIRFNRFRIKKYKRKYNFNIIRCRKCFYGIK